MYADWSLPNTHTASSAAHTAQQVLQQHQLQLVVNEEKEVSSPFLIGPWSLCAPGQTVAEEEDEDEEEAAAEEELLRSPARCIDTQSASMHATLPLRDRTVVPAGHGRAAAGTEAQRAHLTEEVTKDTFTAGQRSLLQLLQIQRAQPLVAASSCSDSMESLFSHPPLSPLRESLSSSLVLLSLLQREEDEAATSCAHASAHAARLQMVMQEMDEKVSCEALAEQIGEGVEECMQVAAESQGRLEECLHRLRELDVQREHESWQARQQQETLKDQGLKNELQSLVHTQQLQDERVRWINSEHTREMQHRDGKEAEVRAEQERLVTLTQALQSQNGELVAKFSLLLSQSESCKERSAWLGSQLAVANEDVKRACDTLAAYERSSIELSFENKELAEALEELEAEMAEKVNEQSTQLQQAAIYIADLHTAHELQQRLLIKQQEQASSDKLLQHEEYGRELLLQQEKQDRRFEAALQEKNTQLQETDTRLQHALLQLQIEQGTVQLLQLRMNAQAEDHTRQRELAAVSMCEHQREHVQAFSRAADVILACHFACAGAEEVIGNLLLRWRERESQLVVQRDLLQAQLRASLTTLLSTRAQMAYERRSLDQLLERTCKSVRACDTCPPIDQNGEGEC